MRTQPLIEQYDDTGNDTALSLLNIASAHTPRRRATSRAARRDSTSQNADRNEQLGPSDKARDGFHVHRMPREDQPGSGGAERRQPASDDAYEQHRGQAVPERVHHMQPSRTAAR